MAVETVGDGGARPCLLETRADAVVYLGAICDFEGTPREWVEIRVQEISGIEGKLESAARDITGPMLDKRWTRMVDGHVGSDGEALVRGPWEHVHGGPVLLNAEGSALAKPTRVWKL